MAPPTAVDMGYREMDEGFDSGYSPYDHRPTPDTRAPSGADSAASLAEAVSQMQSLHLIANGVGSQANRAGQWRRRRVTISPLEQCAHRQITGDAMTHSPRTHDEERGRCRRECGGRRR